VLPEIGEWNLGLGGLDESSDSILMNQIAGGEAGMRVHDL
jgi:hypothetical protein